MKLRGIPNPQRFIGSLDTRARPRWEIFRGCLNDYKIARQITQTAPNKSSFNPFKRASRVQIYTLIAPFGFVSKWGIITVPAGFLTDFGSVPAMAKFMVDDDDPDLLFASIFHDWLYYNKGHIDLRVFTRVEADEVLYDAMIACGAPEFKAGYVYRSVRLGGRGSWKED